jgi:hypothetical protein
MIAYQDVKKNAMAELPERDGFLEGRQPAAAEMKVLMVIREAIL